MTGPEPASGRFLDHATGYVVERESRELEGRGTATVYQLFDAGSGLPVPIEERRRAVDADPGQEQVDPLLGLRWTRRRELDDATGLETWQERLHRLHDGREAARRETIAFNPVPIPTLLDRYRGLREESQAAERFWSGEYLRMNPEDRLAFWLHAVYSQVRWQTESGLDPYAIFEPQTFALWRAREPEIDSILRRIAAAPFWEEEAAEVEQRIFARLSGRT